MKKAAQKLHGLQKICKLYGRVKCGAIMMVWDYHNEIAVPESEMSPGTERWSKSEKARFQYFNPFK